jgi:hypothetical protein
MKDVAIAKTVQIAAAHSSDRDSSNPQDPHSLTASNVEFDVNYSQGAEFVVRIGTPATARLIFRDQRGAIVAGPTTGGKVINDSPVTFTATLSADGQAVLIVPKALGSTILRYFYCHCLTANLIVRVTNRIGPLRPHISVRESVLDFLQALDTDYQPRTIDDILGSVGADRALVEGALEKLVRDGFVRQSGDFWLPLNPASASSAFDSSAASRSQ